jgi:hypothetical protein
MSLISWLLANDMVTLLGIMEESKNGVWCESDYAKYRNFQPVIEKARKSWGAAQ